MEPVRSIFAAEIRRSRVQKVRVFTHWRWHLNEVYVKFNVEMHNLWRAVDHKGEALHSLASMRRDEPAAQNCMKKLIKRHSHVKAVTSDGPRSYKAAMKHLGNAEKQEVDRSANNIVGNSHLPSVDEEGPC